MRPPAQRRIALAAVLAAASLVLPSCGRDGGEPGSAARPAGTGGVDPAVEQRRGTLVAVRKLGAATPGEVRRILRDAGFPDDAVRAGVTAYEVRYRTIDVHGGETVASGLVALPQGIQEPLPVAVYHHGTVFSRDGAPSALRTFEGAPVAALFASDGFAHAAPDYLGLGSGRGPHPYLHAASEATASRDLLRALRSLAARRGVTVTNAVYATGFSQGGQATMALGELLAAAPDKAIDLRALAPIAGPLDLSNATWKATLADSAREDAGRIAARYLAKALLAWDRVYGLFAAPAEVFEPEYAPTIDELVEDGRPGAGPPSVAALLRGEALARLREPDGALAAALHANDSCTTPPAGRVRLYQASGDPIVPPANATRCRASLAALGVTAEIVELGGIGHAASAHAALPLVERWFRQLADEAAE